ncbi:hypothetical protein [Alloyangia pacifica]|uniref:hypothetical protein n=1 Tax=Alloyangia pacifica TaxID=311180 RepID=UPI001CFE430B|nr:hypothetical protein [Alloyangia pacifica]
MLQIRSGKSLGSALHRHSAAVRPAHVDAFRETLQPAVEDMVLLYPGQRQPHDRDGDKSVFHDEFDQAITEHDARQHCGGDVAQQRAEYSRKGDDSK